MLMMINKKESNKKKSLLEYSFMRYAFCLEKKKIFYAFCSFFIFSAFLFQTNPFQVIFGLRTIGPWQMTALYPFISYPRFRSKKKSKIVDIQKVKIQLFLLFYLFWFNYLFIYWLIQSKKLRRKEKEEENQPLQRFRYFSAILLWPRDNRKNENQKNGGKKWRKKSQLEKKKKKKKNCCWMNVQGALKELKDIKEFIDSHEFKK